MHLEAESHSGYHTMPRNNISCTLLVIFRQLNKLQGNRKYNENTRGVKSGKKYPVEKPSDCGDANLQANGRHG